MHIFIHSQSHKAQIEVNKQQVVTTDWVILCLEGQRAGGWKQLVCSYMLSVNNDDSKPEIIVHK